MNHRTGFALSGLGVLALLASTANATVVPFTQITANGPTNVSGQLVLDITDLGGGVISFDLSNAGPIASVVTMFNVDDADSLFSDLTAIVNGTGVTFVEDAPPGNLPAGNTVSFDSDWGTGATVPPPQKGVGPGENVEVKFSLVGGKSFADVLTALGSGALRAGLHVQAIDTAGKSETYVSGPLLPTPGTAALATLGLLGASRRRR